MENKLLKTMNEMIGKEGKAMTRDDLPELVVSDFDVLDLETTLNNINTQRVPGNHGE